MWNNYGGLNVVADDDEAYRRAQGMPPATPQAQGLMGGLSKDDRMLALLGLGAGLMAGNQGRNRQEAFSNAMGSGMQGLLGTLGPVIQNRQAQQAAQDRQRGLSLQSRGLDIQEGYKAQQEQLMQSQIAQQRLAQQRQQQATQIMGRIGQPLDMAPTVENATQGPRTFSVDDALAEMRRGGLLSEAKALLESQPKRELKEVAGQEGRPAYAAFDPYGGSFTQLSTSPFVKPEMVEVADRNRPGRSVKQWMTPTAGQVAGEAPRPDILDPEVRNARATIAREGATRVNVPVSVSTDRTFFGAIADTVGKDIGAQNEAAKAAVGAINNANAIRSILDTGNVILGTGANQRLDLARLAATLGISGRDDKERLANTKGMMQQLASAELAAAQQMKGQGQITEAERDILRRAASGDITLSPGEIRKLSETLDATARRRIQANNKTAQGLSADPRMGGAGQYLMVEEPPQYQAPGQSGFAIRPVDQPPPAQGGFSIRRVQ